MSIRNTRDIKELQDRVRELEARLKALESKPKMGRPAKEVRLNA